MQTTNSSSSKYAMHVHYSYIIHYSTGTCVPIPLHTEDLTTVYTTFSTDKYKTRFQ